MRQKLMSTGVRELQYEIRGIVKKANQLIDLGKEIYWENIGDPIQKGCQVPDWMKEIIIDLLRNNDTYGYCDSKGVWETREFLASRTNALGGVQISSEDILFFNGLGDAISKVYQYILPTSRIIGPSPAYSTHSSAEGAHANDHPVTYQLDPNNSWYPDVEDLYMKVKYNPSIVGILIINPDNPTGMVYPLETLHRMVEIAREFDLFIISDEIYSNVVYNGTRSYELAEFIGDLPAIAMKGISKELPWPGSRCGWVEFYNRGKDESFDRLCNTLENAKMIEVCSTKLPQLAIPKIMHDERYLAFRKNLNQKIGERSKIIATILRDTPGIYFNETFGAFYNTIVFQDGVLSSDQNLPIDDPQAELLLHTWLDDGNVSPDSRFVYYLLASTGICVVPLSSFCSDLSGFRVTLLEENEDRLNHIFTTLQIAICKYLESDKVPA